MTTIDEFTARYEAVWNERDEAVWNERDEAVRNEPDEAVRDARRWAPSRS